MKEKIRIRHYPPTDGAYGYCLGEAISEANQLIEKEKFDLFDIINLFEISLYIDDYDYLNDKGKEKLNPILQYRKYINSTLGRYFATINNDNFIATLSELDGNYHFRSRILKCFVKYKVFDRINEETFEYSLNNDLIFIYDVLRIEKIVRQFNSIIKKKLLVNNEAAELFVKKYDYVEKEKIYFPILSDFDKETIISNYLSNENSNINYLRALNDHIDSVDSYKLTTNQRLEIKKLIKIKGEEIHKHGWTFVQKIGIIIDRNKNDIVEPVTVDGEYTFTFPGKWFDENLDYPTLMNNFIYIFNYFDHEMNITGLANINQESVFERHIFNMIKTNYATGFVFKSIEACNCLSFNSYVKYLKEIHNIDIEDIIEWFFNDYLLNEYNISNFNISLSTDKKYINRCKVLFPEFDGVLKKYRIYSEYKKINNELLEATKEAIKIDDCPSIIKNKYLIVNKENSEIKYILNLLFSDQSHISYINDKLNSSTFAKLIIKHDVKLSDFDDRDFQLKPIQYLLEKGIIYIDNNLIKIKHDILAICKYLYDNNFIRNHNYSIEREFVEKGYLLTYSKLFAPEEADYLCYNLNNSKFGDAKALSNKYRHVDTTSENEDQIYSDYLIGLRMMILIIIKINDELSRFKY